MGKLSETELKEHLLQSDIACVLFRETVGASRYEDRRFITGTLQDSIDGAELFLSRYIAVGPIAELLLLYLSVLFVLLFLSCRL